MSLFKQKTTYKVKVMHYVPTLQEYLTTIVNLCINRNYRVAQDIMYHLHLAVKPSDMMPVCVYKHPVALMPTLDYIVSYLSRNGVYKCLTT